MTTAARTRIGSLDHWWTLCMACTLMWGLWGFLSKLLADRTGAVATQLLFTAGMLPAAIIAQLAARGTVLASPRGATYGLLNGLLTGAGTLCFYAALARGPASLVSALIAAYPLVTIALALLVLRERLSRIQVAGAACAIAGLVLLS
jgi:transporter family protein